MITQDCQQPTAEQEESVENLEQCLAKCEVSCSINEWQLDFAEFVVFKLAPEYYGPFSGNVNECEM